MEKIKLIAGRSNWPLAKCIADCLKLSLVNCVIEKFANTEIRIEISDDIRGCDIYIIQTGGADENNSINDYIMETLLLIDTCKRAGVIRVSVILATYPYARSDKKDMPRVPIGGSVVSRILEAAGCDRIISMDLHSGQIQGFTTLPFDNLYSIKLHIENLKTKIFNGLTSKEINHKFVLVSLDVGGAKRVREYAKRLQMPHVIMDKQRDYSQPGTVLKTILIGDSVEGKTAICIDDMCDTCGTVIAGINDLKEHGVKDAIILATHGIFSGSALDRINACDLIEKIIVVDTLDQTINMTKTSKLEVINSAQLFSEVIRRLVDGGSISQLFV